MALKDGYLCFVEVKYRRDAGHGEPQEAVDYRKQAQIQKVAKFYLMSHHESLDRPIRFDVVAIRGEQFRIFENAFSF